MNHKYQILAAFAIFFSCGESSSADGAKLNQEIKKCIAEKLASCKSVGDYYVKLMDWDRASDYYLKACDPTLNSACRLTATMWAKMGSKQYAELYLETACKMGHETSCSEKNDMDSFMDPHRADAKKWDEGTAARLTSLAAAKEVAASVRTEQKAEEEKKRKEELVAKTKEERTHAALERKCQSGVNRACNDIAGKLMKSDDNENARRVFEIACERRDATACLGAGVLASNGGERTYGKRLLDQSCQLGSLEGCRLVDQIKDSETRAQNAGIERQRVAEHEQRQRFFEAKERELASERQRRADEDFARTMIETQKLMFPASHSQPKTRCRTYPNGSEIWTDCGGL
jgi:hypothetical protein